MEINKVENNLEVKLINFDQDLVDRIKLIEGRKYDKEKKVWLIPSSKEEELNSMHVEYLRDKTSGVKRKVNGLELIQKIEKYLKELKASV